ncbi:hypothetical protein FGSG_13082 [Fusarium graminearum PH-1]|uniref:hypothetical protein n=1 Tax=Gibberella zeae (strain ATCC MYA-4620 / CBS 123657 / FGSC 9075 / NRRL 31084 / PH-1) TaxID=229533 RepID=UPI00021F19CA|nr:hypothetical protein FGSG_13082 [Fusarium graminearum PH-1]ESU13383.1 hypothetical protein FGSG_13082 [Fusarium graminearum PH-1]|eukprot:XP_011326890.1 hypothetical protein FGSG_13082 [Fusarium graminearum PH-1]
MIDHLFSQPYPTMHCRPRLDLLLVSPGCSTNALFPSTFDYSGDRPTTVQATLLGAHIFRGNTVYTILMLVNNPMQRDLTQQLCSTLCISTYYFGVSPARNQNANANMPMSVSVRVDPCLDVSQSTVRYCPQSTDHICWDGSKMQGPTLPQCFAAKFPVDERG